MDWTGFAALTDEWPDEFDDIDCGLLDPDEEDERRIGLTAAHDGVDLAGAEIELHLVAHEIVANQLIADEPPGIRATAERLLAGGFDDHTVLHMIGSAAMEETRLVLTSGEPFDVDRYRAALASLPESWFDLVDEDDDDFLDDDFSAPFEHARDRVEQLLRAEGPMHVDELVARTGLDGHSSRSVLQWLVWHEDFAHVLPDGRVSHEQNAVDGVVLIHPLTDQERALGRILVDDLELLLVVKEGAEPLALAAGGAAELHIRRGLDDDRRPGDDDVDSAVWLLEGPAGWLDGCDVPGHIALRWRDGALSVEPTAIDDAAADAAAAALSTVFTARDGFDDDLAHRDDGALELVDVLLDVLVAEPEVLRRPTAPTSDLVDRAGLSRRGGFVAPGSYDWDEHDRRREESLRGHAIRDAGVPYEEHAIARRTIEQFDSWRRGERIDARVAARVGATLRTTAIAVATFSAIGRYGRMTEVAKLADVAAAIADAGGSGAGGAHLLAALAADGARAGARASRHVHEALSLGVSDEELDDLALAYLVVEGDLGRAARYLHVDDDDWELVSLLAPFRARAGRNDPCPCGSGAKHKQCHGRPGGPARSATEHARLVHHKALLVVQRARGITVVAALQHLGWSPEVDEQPTVAQRAIATDLALFEGGGLGVVLSGWGDVLPSSERQLLESWMRSPITLVAGDLTRVLPVGDAAWRPWSVPIGDADPDAVLESLRDANHVDAARQIATLLEQPEAAVSESGGGRRAL